MMSGGRAAGADSEPIDWNVARSLRQKQQQGESLDAAERAYLARAMAVRQPEGSNERSSRAILEALSPEDREQARQLMQKRQRGETFTAEERALMERFRTTTSPRPEGGVRSATASSSPAAPDERFSATPLTEMTAGQRYKGREGGLYGDDRNEPPPAQLRAALAAAAQIIPRAPDGEPNEKGKVVLLSVGMSNTTQEFSRFKELADREPAKARAVVIVDGAQGGQAAAEWAESGNSPIWETVAMRLKKADVTENQVQVVWVKQADKRPTAPFPAHAQKLEANLEAIVYLLHAKFPHLRLIYFSSRTYGGYAVGNLNPEPYAFESAFAVRDLVRRQISGDPKLNVEPGKGAVRAPVLLWGPYLWANGPQSRHADGLSWQREDFREDGTHPSATIGREKVAQQLLTFLKADLTAQQWFLAPAASTTR